MNISQRNLAAFEGHYETGPAGMSLFAIPDEENERLNWNIEVPGGLSFLLHEDFNEPVIGLDKFSKADRPPVAIPYLAYHLMIGSGVSLTLMMVASAILLFRRKLFEKRWLLWLLVFSIAPAIVGNEAGWVAAEVGRQPWIVQAPLET